MTTAEIFRLAATHVRHGWTQGALSEYGLVCAAGGIISAFCELGDGVTPPSSADRALMTFCRVMHFPTPLGTIAAIARWNDAEDQTAENVAAGLGLAAVLWEEEEAAKLRGEPLPLQAQGVPSPLVP